MKRALCAGILALIMAGSAAAQQQIEWKQTVNTPKGLNTPQGANVDVLGIAPGDSYADVKAKMQKLLAETSPPKAAKPESLLDQAINESTGERSGPPLREIRTQLRLPAPGGYVTASYVGSLMLERSLPASVPVGTSDNITVRLSAPSSGHQVIGIDRILMYPTQADEPRVSEVMGILAARMGGAPQKFDEKLYKFQFAKGNLVAPPGAGRTACQPQYTMNTSGDIPRINQGGGCDVVFVVEFQLGMSSDHAKYIKMTLSDNERTKANVGADFAFFDAYARDLQARSRGTPPKL